MATPTQAPSPTLAALDGSTPAAVPTPAPAAASNSRRARKHRPHRPAVHKYGWTTRGIMGFGVEPGMPGHQLWLRERVRADPLFGLNARGRAAHAQETMAAAASRMGTAPPPATTVDPSMLSSSPATVNPLKTFSFPPTTVNPSVLSFSPAPGEMEATKRDFYAERRVMRMLARRAERETDRRAAAAACEFRREHGEDGECSEPITWTFDGCDWVPESSGK